MNPSTQLFVFEVDGGAFAVPTSFVREVLRAVALFPLPEYPYAVAGGLNLRGVIVPVLDARSLLRRPPRDVVPSDHIIVLEVDGQLLAIHVDRALELVAAEIPADSNVTGEGRLIRAIVNSPRGPTAIFDVAQLALHVQSGGSLAPSAGGGA